MATLTRKLLVEQLGRFREIVEQGERVEVLKLLVQVLLILLLDL